MPSPPPASSARHRGERRLRIGRAHPLDDPPCLSGWTGGDRVCRNPLIDRADRNSISARTGQVAVGRNARTQHARTPVGLGCSGKAAGKRYWRPSWPQSEDHAASRGLAETDFFIRVCRIHGQTASLHQQNYRVYKGSCRHFRLCRVKARSYDASGWESYWCGRKVEAVGGGRVTFHNCLLRGPVASCCSGGD